MASRLGAFLLEGRRVTNIQWLQRRVARLSWLLSVLSFAPCGASAQGPGTEGGMWSYLGGDAWHTRYTPADEITADNFDQLTMLWRFDASSFGPSTPRATPSYIGDKLITVTGDRRHVIKIVSSLLIAFFMTSSLAIN